ncbi:hypothetical protein GALL_496520 [mine drainage metagenome]|uniref:Uncharacterized protein n=1 Tax=mine drainage metagenome TaxID=410659 RepID=A0A1J5PLT7_9ZZZZ
MAEHFDIISESPRTPSILDRIGRAPRPSHLRLVESVRAPARAPLPPQSAILRAFRRLVAAVCIASGAEAEAAGIGWDLATGDWQAEVDAGWRRVQDLSALVARQKSGNSEDAGLIGAARLIHSAVTCDTADRLFGLREQMRIILDVCRASGRGGHPSPQAHLLFMCVGLLEDMCDRLLASETDDVDPDADASFLTA